MKTDKRLEWLAVGLTYCLLASALSAQTNIDWSSASDTEVMLHAIEQTTPAPASSAPRYGNFYSAQHAPGTAQPWPPMPGNPKSLNWWNLGQGFILLDDLDIDYSATTAGRMSMMGAMDAPMPPGGGGSGDGLSHPTWTPPTNGLWLQWSNVVDGTASLNLMNATDYVYEIFSKTNLLEPDWDIASEVFPTNTTCQPFNLQLSTFNPQLFVWARDWTGVNTNGLPAWWCWKWFGNFYEASNSLDADGDTLQFDYLYGLDPSHVLFSLEFTNQYINTSTTYGALIVYGGYPYYMAVLANDSNTNDAVWLPFTSTNVPVSFNNGSGTYTIGIGLKGFAPNAQPQWQWDTLVYNDIETVPWNLIVTNPVSGNVSVPVIQLQGLVNRALSQLTYDVSNALGIVTNQGGYWGASFYDTNVLAFTTNAFQCYDIRLTNGLNTITLHATDLEGNVVTTNISYTLSYIGVTNVPEISIIWPQSTPVGGGNVTVQAQTDDATAIFSASVNGNSIQGLVERNGTVWFQNVPLNAGTNVVTIGAINAAGNVNTTNLTIVQSSVNLTVNPISSDQLNQSLVSLTGTVSDPSQNVWVNGIPAIVDGYGNWMATDVPVNNINTAELHVQAGTATNNIQSELISDEAQPPTVTMFSYTMTYHEIDWGYNSWCYDKGPTVGEDVTAHWVSGNGQTHEHEIGWDGECPDLIQVDDSTADLSGYITDYPVPWLKANNSSVFEAGELSAKLNVETELAIQPSGQRQTGTMENYIVLVSALEYAADNIYDMTYLRLGEFSYMDNAPVPPGQITVNGQRAIDTGIVNDDGTTYGLVAVSAPSGTVAPLIPAATLSNPNDATVFQMQAYQLVSQCVATTPSDQSRTNIGVGEQVNLSFNPALPTNAIWTTTAGSLSVTSGITNLFTAPDRATNVTITAKIGNAPINFYFKVIEPSGYISAQITGTNHYPVGTIGAGMTNIVTVFPTNVSFSKVELVELPCIATNITGYFTNASFSPIDIGYAQLDSHNSCIDIVTAYYGEPDFPIYPGGWDINVPVVWEITGSSVTNNFGTFHNPVRLLNPAGDLSNTKYDITITRSTNDVSYSSK